MPYPSLYAEECHASIELAASMVNRFAAELAEALDVSPSETARIETFVRDMVRDVVSDAIPVEMWEASRQYDDSNPLREAA